jgi:SAM-dependent methyltransferase
MAGNEGQRNDWNARAAEWAAREKWTHAAMAPLTAPLVELAKPGMRVLDVGTGSGQPALTVAPLVEPGGSVLGVDLSAEMLSYARKNAEEQGAKNVEFRELDGEDVSFPTGSFDLALARCSLMFMAEPRRALEGIRKSLVSGGRIGCLVWTALDRNPWVAIPERMAAERFNLPKPEPGAPGMFALGADGRLASLLDEAGFQQVETREVETEFAFEDAERFWELRGRYTLGRLKTPPAEQAVTAFHDALMQALEPYRRPDGAISSPATALFGTGVAP